MYTVYIERETRVEYVSTVTDPELKFSLFMEGKTHNLGLTYSEISGTPTKFLQNDY